MRSLMPEGFLFRHFFDGLAVGGALAEWGLACWLLDLEVPVGFHLVVPALLGVVNRLAARRFQREPGTGPLTGRAGDVTLAIAFRAPRSEEHTSELQSQSNLVCRLLPSKNKNT